MAHGQGELTSGLMRAAQPAGSGRRAGASASAATITTSRTLNSSWVRCVRHNMLNSRSGLPSTGLGAPGAAGCDCKGPWGAASSQCCPRQSGPLPGVNKAAAPSDLIPRVPGLLFLQRNAVMETALG